jgi:hypothetical protein
VPVEELVEIMVDKNVPSSPITTNDGRLVGLLLREDIVPAPDQEGLEWSPAEPS